MALEYSELLSCENCSIMVRYERDNSTTLKTWLCPNCGHRAPGAHARTFVAGPNKYNVGADKQGTVNNEYALKGADVEGYATVVDLSDNAPLVLNSVADQVCVHGVAMTNVTVTAKQKTNGSTLSFSATGLPAGTTCSSAGLISGIPTTAGSYTVTVTAVDDVIASHTASVGFTFTVS